MKAIYAVLAALAIAAPVQGGQFTSLITAAFSPSPAPPSPSGICDNCNGTGKLGDGTVSVTCPVCNGTGKSVGTTPTPPVGLEAPPSPSAEPQAISGSRRPAGVLTADQLPADQQPSPMEAIGAALRAVNVKGKPFVDVGCGFDARASIAAVRDFGASSALAIEIDPIVATSARAYVKHAGLADKIKVVNADAAEVEWPAGAVGYGYLWPETLGELAPKIAKLDQFASFAHAVPGLAMQQVGDVFVYSKPAPQPVQQFRREPIYATVRGTATWNGRQYSHRVCSNPSCRMCRAISDQLASTSRQVVGYRNVPVNTQAAPQQAAPSGHWETVRVKRCNGRQCWCETQRKWVPN